MKIKTTVIWVTLTAFFGSCNHSKQEETTVANKESNIEFVYAAYQKPETILRLPGELKPFYETEIYAKVNGFVNAVNVDRGSQVKKGDLLATIDAPELQAQLSEANAKVEAARSVFYSSKATYMRLLQSSKMAGAVSPNELEIALSKMNVDSANILSAQSAYNSVAEMKNYLNIYAPFNGVITERNISPGTLVGKDRSIPMLKLKQEDVLRLEVAVPEKNTSSIEKNQTVKFSVSAFPGKDFTGTLARQSESILQDIRSEMIEFDVKNADRKLKSGMYVEVEMNLQRSDSTLFVPKTAVVSSTERTFVIRDSSGFAEWLDVKKGTEVADKIEIWGDIHSQDKLVKTASEQIREGKPLE